MPKIREEKMRRLKLRDISFGYSKLVVEITEKFMAEFHSEWSKEQNKAQNSTKPLILIGTEDEK